MGLAFLMHPLGRTVEEAVIVFAFYLLPLGPSSSRIVHQP
jgi:hypothetical protein